MQVACRHGEMCVGDGSGRRCDLTLLLSESFSAKNNSLLTHFEQPETGRVESPLWEGCTEVAKAMK